MKKLTVCLLVLLLLAFACVCASADTEILQSGDFRYILLEDGSAAIITAETEGALVIPAELDGHPVTSIGLDKHPDTYLLYKDAGLFGDGGTILRGVVNKNCTSLSIPDSVTTIGVCAFMNCVNLKEASVPEGVTAIGNAAFRDCGSLEIVTLPESVEAIAKNAFDGCEALILVVPPDSFSDEYCQQKHLHHRYPGQLLPETTLRQSGIYQYVLMEDGTAAIITADGEGELVIPAELDGYPVSRIGLEVSDIQEEIYFAANIYILDDDDELTIDRSVIDGNFTGVILPEGITVIGAEAFCVCDWLTEITLPESVTYIGEYAFYQSGLTAITLPDGVETVEERAFRKCSSLSSGRRAPQLFPHHPGGCGNS
jgi:hypothetical protein